MLPSPAFPCPRRSALPPHEQTPLAIQACTNTSEWASAEHFGYSSPYLVEPAWGRNWRGDLPALLGWPASCVGAGWR